MIVVFLPAYNEELALPRLVKKFVEEMRLLGEPYQIVVLDDGSSDGTLREAERLSKEIPLVLLRHEKNKGLGETMRDGLEYLAKTTAPDDAIITLDCDDTHEPRFFPAALKKLREGYDVVILSRFCEGGGERGLSFTKSLLSRGAGIFLQVLFPIKGVKEYSCGYRVIRASILKTAVEMYGKDFIRLAHMGFVVTPEILIRFRMLGARIAESPFILRYDQKPTPSKNKSLRTIQGYFALVWNYWGRRIRRVSFHSS